MTRHLKRRGYNVRTDCGFCETRAVRFIGGIGVCKRHDAIVRDIRDGVPEPVRRPTRVYRQTARGTVRIVTLLCPCGKAFTHRAGQGNRRKWCDGCRQIDYATRMRRMVA